MPTVPAQIVDDDQIVLCHLNVDQLQKYLFDRQRFVGSQLGENFRTPIWAPPSSLWT